MTDVKLMRKLIQILLLSTVTLFTFSVLAETVKVPRAANVRSSRTFYGQENILDQLPQDAQVEVISRKALPSGADALEIKIISPADKISLNEQKPIYIWQSKTEIETQAFKTEAGVACTDGCDEKKKPTPVSTKDIKEIVKKIEEQQSEEPNPTTTAVGSLAAAIKIYSESEQVKKSFDWAKSRKPWATGKCYRHTKEALATQTKGGKGPGNNLIPKWFGGDDADQAKEGLKNLKDRGFVNLLDHSDYKDMTSRTAPHGSVLIYKHVNSKGVEDGLAGHAEIKFDDTVNGKKVQRYFYGPLHNYPVNNREGNRYRLIGVMIKSPLAESKKQK